MFVLNKGKNVIKFDGNILVQDILTIPKTVAEVTAEN